MIKLENVTVTKDYQQIFKDLNLEFERGKSYALIGKSGSGKSTLLNIIAGLEDSKNHDIYIEGKKERFRTSFYRYKLGYLFQNYGLIETKSIDENLDIGLKFLHLSKKEKKELKSFYFKKFEVTADLKRKIHTLSGGEQQRIALSRLILKNPKIILADEPTVSLDAKNGQKIIKALLSLKAKDRVIIIATHDQLIAKQCDEIINVEDYRV
ncbi:ATP-binding cassette domain-containing protein [Staphylococcus capitis]|uniref:ATP-binding cassette domain-containing protein n=1 Tax=Staphylococcus capitis TaxID=29388 RepID=UPI00345B7D1D